LVGIGLSSQRVNTKFSPCCIQQFLCKTIHNPTYEYYYYYLGSTNELAVMVKHVIARYNCYHLIGVGFSMGANVLLKYFGEEPSRQMDFTCAVSVCQGYDIIR